MKPETPKKERVRIRDGWAGAGKQGTRIGPDFFSRQEWTPILLDDDEDPTFYKAACLEVVPEEEPLPEKLVVWLCGDHAVIIRVASVSVNGSRSLTFREAEEVVRRWNIAWPRLRKVEGDLKRIADGGPRCLAEKLAARLRAILDGSAD